MQMHDSRPMAEHATGRFKIEKLRRATVETYIEQLIMLLDQMDGDPDLEETGDMEPSVGSVPKLIGKQIVDDLEWDTADDEFSIGWGNPRIGDCTLSEGWSATDDEDFGFLTGFNGDGQRIGRKLLRDHRRVTKSEQGRAA